MSYKALYRTYRPQTFKDIVGQEIIVKTLQQAVKVNKPSHAYLFSGPRGTGKTSVARILAKAVNCPSSIDGEPCDACQVCKEISEGNHPDVIEIDAASNNGVDEIRDIRDKVKFLPGTAKFKVYIIDEVHMLSQGAFNALLKTLEEPPKHVLFILATTEPHKIPLTILSRCQRFDFKSLSIEGITSKLEEVIALEEIQIDQEAIQTIAESAEGGMRDALGVLDQAVSYSDGTVNVDDIYAVTGNVSTDKIIELAEAFEAEDVTKALSIVSDLLDLGKETSKLVNNILQFYRDVLLYRHIDVSLIRKYIFEKKDFQQLAKNIDEKKIYHYINQLSDLYNKMRYASNPRIFLEVAIIKMIHDKEDEGGLIAKIETLEERVESLSQREGTIASGDEHQPVDDQRVTLIDTKLNRVISELSRLEIHKLHDEVKMLKEMQHPTDMNDDQTKLKLQSLEQRVTELSRIQVAENKQENSEQFALLQKEIEKVKEKYKSDSNIDFESFANNVSNDIAKLKSVIDSIKQQDQKQNRANGAQHTENFSTIMVQERLDDIEDKLYRLIAGTLQAQSLQQGKFKKGKPSSQVTLFGDEVIQITELKEEDSLKKDSLPNVMNQTVQVKESVDLEHQKTKEEQQRVDIQIQEQQTKMAREETKKQEEIVFDDDSDYVDDEESIDENQTVNVEEEPKEIETKDHTQQESLLKEKQDVPNVKEESKEGQQEKYHITSHTYDVRIIERILHNSRSSKSKELKESFTNQWRRLGEDSDASLLSFAEILKEGTLVALGEKELIITFEGEVLVNQVMRPRFKKRALKVLQDTFEEEIIYYLALPVNDWLEKRKEYIQQYNMGFKHPRLTPIENPLLKEVTDEEEFIDDKQKTIEKTIEIFGEGLVKVE